MSAKTKRPVHSVSPENGTATALQIAKSAILDQLISKLGNLYVGDQKKSLTRGDVIALLEVLVGSLRPFMSEVIGGQCDNIVVVSDHPAVEKLDQFVGLLKDLDRGKSPELFMPAPHASPAALSSSDQKNVETWIEALRVMLISKKFKNKTEAAKSLASLLNTIGCRTSRGDLITADYLRRLDKRPFKPRPPI